MNAAIMAAAEGGEHAAHVELPMDPIWYGLITLAIFITMGVVSRSWKGISQFHLNLVTDIAKTQSRCHGRYLRPRPQRPPRRGK